MYLQQRDVRFFPMALKAKVCVNFASLPSHFHSHVTLSIPFSVFELGYTRLRLAHSHSYVIFIRKTKIPNSHFWCRPSTQNSASSHFGRLLPGIFLHPLRGNTPYFFTYTPDQLELVNPMGVKFWTDSEPRQHGTFKMLDCLRKVLFRPTLEYSLGQLWLLYIQLLQ